MALENQRNVLGNGYWIEKTRIIIVLFTIAICAFFLAKGSTRLIAISSMPLDGTHSILSVQRIEQPKEYLPPGSQNPNPKEILKRNIFDSSTGPLWPPPTYLTQVLQGNIPDHKKASPVPTAHHPPPECEQNLFLVASVYNPQQPDRSIVALEGPEEVDTQHLYQSGMKVGDSEIISVLPYTAYLRQSSGQYCSLRLYTERKPKVLKKSKRKKKKTKKAKKGKRKKKRTKKRSALSIREIKKGIKEIGNNSFQVDRELAEKALRHNLSAVRKVKAVPFRQGGEVHGVKLYRIQRNSLLGQLGIRNGDLISSINGYDLNSIDSALEAYSVLKNTDHITINLKRRNQRQTVNVKIQ